MASAASATSSAAARCLLIPSYPSQYSTLDANLRSLRHHAVDALPPVHIVLDTIRDADAAVSQNRFHSSSSSSNLHIHSLQGLMRAAGEDASTDPGVRSLMEEARRRHCTGQGGRGAHLCGASFFRDGPFHSRCRQRCLSGQQPPLSSLPPLPSNATVADRMRQIARSGRVSASGRRPVTANESACRADCEAIAAMVLRLRTEASSSPLLLPGSASSFSPSPPSDYFDLFADENKAYLTDVGDPPRGPPPCKPMAPWGHHNFKRKYQALKKWYGAQHAYRHAGCALIWVMDSDSLAFRRFSFDSLFRRYEARPTVFVSGLTSPKASRCHLQTLLSNWGEGDGEAEGAASATIESPWVDAVDLEPFHDDLWLWEGPIVDDLLTRMRGGAGGAGARGRPRGRSVAATYLNGTLYGTYSEQLVYSNWILIEQRRRPGAYQHVRRLDVERLAVERWPQLQLKTHLAYLRSHKHPADGHPMLGPTLARLYAAFSRGVEALLLSAAATAAAATASETRARLRREFIGLLNESDWVYVRGWQPSPWGSVEALLPEWPGALCLSNCALDSAALKRRLARGGAGA